MADEVQSEDGRDRADSPSASTAGEEGGQGRTTTRQSQSSSVAGAADVIVLKVRDQNGDEVSFRMKKTSTFKRMFSAYFQKKHINPLGFKIISPEGKRVRETDTPNDHDLENEDCLEALTDQYGGGTFFTGVSC